MSGPAAGEPRRSWTLRAPGGMVCSVDHLASSAGIAMLRAGGSAVDAAVAASAVLAVTSQHMCGMGGDLFALVHTGDGPPAVLNASGRAGSGADPERLRAEGHRQMPFRGDIRSVTVPGCVDGWTTLHERFGRLPLREVLAPAAGYAANGFPASPLLAASVVNALAGVAGPHDFEPAPASGELVRRPGLAAALVAIAAGGRDAFYGGPFGEGLLGLGGGEYTTDDLARSQADWVAPLGVDVWGHRVWTVPPNSQGYLNLAGAWIAAGLDLPADGDDPLGAHLLIEAARQAGHDRPAVLADDADGARLISPERLAPRRAAIDPDRRAVLRERFAGGGTMYLCAVDADRMGVSLIQSNASGFGAHVIEPRTAIFLHNRGIGFSVDEGHPAEYRPGRRPPHTLAPALVTHPDGRLRAVLGTMGGDAQPQVVLQLLERLLRRHRSAGAAVGSARWALATEGTGFDTWEDPDATVVQIEPHAPAGWDAGLTGRGHVVARRAANYGHAHVIDLERNGEVLAGGADPRARTGATVGY
ncbi:MAG: gamma-glutamyltransferase [Actinomycetota bacterium]|nr:gamma-glutamyltransferase [Actinomycetota bacterium]